MSPLRWTAAATALAHLALLGIVFGLDMTVGLYGIGVTVGLAVDGKLLGTAVAAMAVLGGCGSASMAAVYSAGAFALWGRLALDEDDELLVRAVEVQGRCLRWTVAAGWLGWTAGALVFAWGKLLG